MTESKYVISEDPKDVEEALAPEHYGDEALSCDGAEDPALSGLLDQARELVANARAAFSSYPSRPGSLSKYGSTSARGWGS